jgi:AcrR family transcriptional regulator
MPITLPNPVRTLGRPRSEHSRTALLDAAYRFLQNQPVAVISSFHIAREAGVSTATMYRWWPTKETLLLDAFLYKTKEESSIGTKGSPLDRLKQHVIQVGRFFGGKEGIVVARLLTAIQDNPPLRDAFLERVSSPRSEAFREVVMEAIHEGQLPATTNVKEFADMLFGPLFMRLLIGHEPISDDFVISTFEQIVAGAKARFAAQKRKSRK